MSKRLFSHSTKDPSNQSDIYFHNTFLNGKNTLGLFLDAKLNFSEHTIEKFKASSQRY